MHVVRTAHLFVAKRRRIPVLQNSRRIALPIAGRVAKTVEEITSRAGGLGDAGLRVASVERAIVVNHVEFTLYRVDDDVAGLGVVIHRIAVQPVAFQRAAGHVEIDPAGMVGDSLALADVVWLRRVNVLHDVIEEPPFPDHVALHVHLDDGIHLSVTAIRALPGISTGS